LGGHLLFCSIFQVYFAVLTSLAPQNKPHGKKKAANPPQAFCTEKKYKMPLAICHFSLAFARPPPCGKRVLKKCYFCSIKKI